MKKILLIISLLLTAIVFIGCGEKEETKTKPEEKPKTEVKEEAKPSDKDKEKPKEEPVQTPKPVEIKKAPYTEKIKQVEASISDLAKYYSGIPVEQKYAADEEYARWDKLLNEIYGVLKSQMSESDFKKLETEQIKWIKDKDVKAKEASKKYEGGTQYEVEYAFTLGQVTKERCKYLVNNYMK